MKEIIKSLEEAVAKLEEKEKSYKLLEKEVGELNVKIWNLEQENKKLQSEIERWKSVVALQRK